MGIYRAWIHNVTPELCWHTTMLPLNCALLLDGYLPCVNTQCYPWVVSTHNVTPKLCTEYFVRLTLTNFDWVFDKLLLVIWSVPHKFSFATHSLRIFWIQRILLYGGNTMIKWNSNLPPMRQLKSSLFLLLPTTRRQYYHRLHRCCGNFFTHPPLPEVWPCSQNFWSRKLTIFGPHIAW